MSCTAPINITYVSNKCDSKCDFKPNYSDSTCVATKMSNYITCSYDANSAQSITYNTTSYDVSEVRIYSPSLHMYDGSYISAEVVIMHTASSNFENLLVCIPVTTSRPNNVNKVASSNILYIISAISTCETATGCNVVFAGSTTTFNLNNFIPIGVPFFTYNGTFPWCDTTSGNVNYIVFEPGSFNISCEQKELVYIPQNSYTLTKNPPALFINPNGVNTNSSSGNVYIDCVPVETSVNETTMYANASSMPSTLSLSLPSVNMDMLWKILTVFISLIIIIILIVAYYKVVALFKTMPDSK